jgi:hypothetical protein
MKKILTLTAALIISLAACADLQQLVKFNQLPILAQNFIKKYYSTTDISYIEKEKEGMHHDYTVHLNSGTEIEFNYQGNLQSIDCQINPIPQGIIPKTIMEYVIIHYPDSFIVEYQVDYIRQIVELNNRLELIFDLKGNFLKIDD